MARIKTETLKNNTMNITTIVFAHGDAIQTINRHLPIWKAYTDNLLIVSPNNNPCMIEGVNCLIVEKRQHHGKHALRRTLLGMKAALIYNSDFYVFLEYDAIMLKRPKPRALIQGNFFESFYNQDKDKIKNGKCFIHFPWIFPADKLKEFVDKIILDPKDEIAHDIWLIQKLTELNMDVHNLLGLTPNSPNGTGEGYSQNSLDTPQRIENAVYLVKNGAYALHGIKTKEVLEQILEAAGQQHFLQ